MTVLSKRFNLHTSFRFKLFGIFTLLTAVGTLLLGGLYAARTIREQRSNLAEQVHLQLRHLAETVRLPLYAENREALQEIVETVARAPEIHTIRITGVDGTVLAENQKPETPHPADLLVETVEVRSTPLFGSTDTLFVAEKGSTDTLIGRVRMERKTSDLNQAIRRDVAVTFGLAALFWLAVSGLSYPVLRRVTRSFDDLVKGVERMRSGDYGTRIEVRHYDEPGRAAAAINELAASLQQRDEENRRLHEELLNALRIEVQNEKKMLMAKLIQTNRMTSLGLLASSMAHEINNPIGSIRMANQYLSRAWENALPLLLQLSEEEGDFSLGGIPFSTARSHIPESCVTIDRSSTRIANVVNDLRSYSLGERNEPRPGVNVNQVVADAVDSIHAHGKHFEANISVTPAVEIPSITGSHHQLVQVVVNLLLNAVQALPNGKGDIYIGTGFDQAEDIVRITVRDKGAGIPQEDMVHLFEPFFSTRIDKGGSGLGLFVTDFIVTEHNGRLDFVSRVGSGTTVTVRLPVHPPAPQT
jgi:signal transduction histidine kinase